MFMTWSFRKEKEPEWPDNKNGEPIRAVLLERLYGGALDLELTLSLLKAYDIPYMINYPNHGLIDKVILGYPLSGTEIFVPDNMLEDAQNVLNAVVEDMDDTEEEV